MKRVPITLSAQHVCDRFNRVSPTVQRNVTVSTFASHCPRDPMPLNIPGTLVPFHLLINPRLVIPALSVRGVRFVKWLRENLAMLTLDWTLLVCCSRSTDIRQLDFVALKAAGYRGAVVDKDNCLVRPPHSHSTRRREFLNFQGFGGRFARPYLTMMNSSRN